MRVTRALRCQPPSQIEDRSEASRISGSAGEATRPKIVATEKIVKYFTIRTVLGIGTGNSSAVVSVVPSDRSSKRGALLGPKRHPKCQDRTSIGVFRPSLSRTEIECLPRAKARRYLKMMKEVQYGDVAVVRSRFTGIFIANALPMRLRSTNPEWFLKSHKLFRNLSHKKAPPRTSSQPMLIYFIPIWR
jgi:hypothetical protein